MEFSKKVAALSWAVALTLTALAVILPNCGKSTEGVLAALPYAWTEVGVVNAFYLWKAKNDNRSKYAQSFVDKIAKKYGIDAAIRIAEVVLKD